MWADGSIPLQQDVSMWLQLRSVIHILPGLQRQGKENQTNSRTGSPILPEKDKK